jgi:hypothetical protein
MYACKYTLQMERESGEENSRKALIFDNTYSTSGRDALATYHTVCGTLSFLLDGQWQLG